MRTLEPDSETTYSSEYTIDLIHTRALVAVYRELVISHEKKKPSRVNERTILIRLNAIRRKRKYEKERDVPQCQQLRTISSRRLTPYTECVVIWTVIFRWHILELQANATHSHTHKHTRIHYPCHIESSEREWKLSTPRHFSSNWVRKSYSAYVRSAH